MWFMQQEVRVVGGGGETNEACIQEWQLHACLLPVMQCDIPVFAVTHNQTEHRSFNIFY